MARAGSEQEQRLGEGLASVIDDVLFAAAATGVIDEGELRELAERREPVYEARVRGEKVATPESRFAWVMALTRALAPIHPPSFLPMRELVRKDLTLEGGARGVRSLFASKPSAKDVDRVRRLGSLALRVASAVMGADGAFSPDEGSLRAAFVTSLGLDDPDSKALLDEGPPAPSSIEVYGELDAKTRTELVRGAWLVAAQDGLDQREEDAIAVLAGRLSVPLQQAVDMRAGVREEIEERSVSGRVFLDATRYLLADDPQARSYVGELICEIAIPPATRAEAQRALRDSGPFTLGAKSSLDRKRRAGALAVAWAAGLRENPTIARRAVLAARHDRIASDLGIAGDGPRVRGLVEGVLDARAALLARTLNL